MRFSLLMSKLIFKLFGKMWNCLSAKSYMKHYLKYLKKIGVNIKGTPNYISSDSYFDSHFYSCITICNDTVISREVLLLTHDYSIARGVQIVKGKYWDDNKHIVPHIVGKIYIGENSFVGARATILPNTYIGDNCIIGAGAVVKGTIPNNSIVVGNPCKIIGNTVDWGRKHVETKDYIM